MIQHTIKFFIEILNTLHITDGLENVTIETFRLAKYNEPSLDVSHCLWNIIHGLVRLDLSPLSFLSPLTSFKPALLDTLIDFCKYFLLKWKYPAVSFFSLTKDSVETRELLLCTGWLAAKVRLFQQYPYFYRIQAHHINKIPSTLHGSLPQMQPISDSPPETHKPLKTTSQKATESFLKYKYQSMINELKKVHSSTALLTKFNHHLQTINLPLVPPLSLYELGLLGENDALQKHVSLIERFEVLKAESKTHDTQFFRWMDSILDLKNKNLVSAKMAFVQKTPRSSLSNTLEWKTVVQTDEQLSSSTLKELLHECQSKMFHKRKAIATIQDYFSRLPQDVLRNHFNEDALRTLNIIPSFGHVYKNAILSFNSFYHDISNGCLIAGQTQIQETKKPNPKPFTFLEYLNPQVAPDTLPKASRLDSQNSPYLTHQPKKLPKKKQRPKNNTILPETQRLNRLTKSVESENLVLIQKDKLFLKTSILAQFSRKFPHIQIQNIGNTS